MTIEGGRKSRVRAPGAQARLATAKRARAITEEVLAAKAPRPPSRRVGPPAPDSVGEAAASKARPSDRSIEEIAERLERRNLAALREAEAEAARAEVHARWSHKWEGTPETHERFNAAPDRMRRVGHSAIHRMHALGKISSDELAAAEEIASVVEMIERAVSVRSGSLEARVDCAGSARDQLIESLGRVRLELTYRAWRKCIPNPKRMIIDMVTTNVPYVRLAASHGMHWRTARKRLITALRMWPQFKDDVRHFVDRDDVNAAYARLGEGTLLAPRPKPAPPALSEDEAA